MAKKGRRKPISYPYIINNKNHISFLVKKREIRTVRFEKVSQIVLRL